MKVWVLYNSVNRRYVSGSYSAARMCAKINSLTRILPTKADALKAKKDLVLRVRSAIDYDVSIIQDFKDGKRGETFGSSQKMYEAELKKDKKLLTRIEESQPIEVPIPIIFDKRRKTHVEWKDCVPLSRYCVCCGVRIPQRRCVRVNHETLCVMCLSSLAKRAADDVAEFERDYPDQVEIYKTEKFLEAL